MHRLMTMVIAAAIATPAAGRAPSTLPPELTDPSLADKLGSVMQSLSNALLNLPVGEVQAAIEGRPVTPADQRTTVRELGRRGDPDFDRRVQQQIAGSRETVRAGMAAVSAAVPAMMNGLNEARREMEKAIENMPSRAYPKQ